MGFRVGDVSRLARLHLVRARSPWWLPAWSSERSDHPGSSSGGRVDQSSIRAGSPMVSCGWGGSIKQRFPAVTHGQPRSVRVPSELKDQPIRSGPRVLPKLAVFYGLPLHGS